MGFPSNLSRWTQADCRSLQGSSLCAACRPRQTARQERVRKPTKSGKSNGAIGWNSLSLDFVADKSAAPGHCPLTVACIKDRPRVLVILFRLWSENGIDLVIKQLSR